MPPKKDLSGNPHMDVLLAGIDKTNATLDSVPLRRQLARSASCRGVEGLPKSEDFQLPKYVEVDRRRVEQLVKESQGGKRGLVADPGGRAFMQNQYLKPATLNAWQQARALMPPRSYKTWRGPVQDGRELYRWHAQPEDVAPPDPEKMGQQHKDWMVGHNIQREKHLYPIYFHRQKIKHYHKTKENRAADRAEVEALAKLDGKDPPPDTAKPMGPEPLPPAIGPPPININPPLFKHTEKASRALYLVSARPLRRAPRDEARLLIRCKNVPAPDLSRKSKSPCASASLKRFSSCAGRLV
ncbi:unnamed protein product [Amoebophrya sp. A120]|nr:unnamed protein product [Amoebophrya sp. A120]|eukprot:GSA120T00014745001.1